MFRAGTCALLLAACSARCGGGPNRLPYVEVRRTPASEAPAPTEAPAPEPVQPYVAPAVEPFVPSDPAPEVESEPAAVAQPRRPLPDEPLAIDVRGERFPFRNAFAWSRGGRALFVSFSTRASAECRDPEHPAADERSVHVVVAPSLASQGGHWRASDIVAFLRTDLLRAAGDPDEFPAAIEGEPSEPGDRVRGAVDADAGALRVRGRFEALYCGDQPGLPPPESFPHVALEVGRERVIVRGARVLLQDDMVRLVLSSAGRDCRALHRGADVELELIRHHESGQTDIYLRGHRVGDGGAAEILGAGVATSLRYTIDDVLTEGTTTRAELFYADEVGAIPVGLRGTVDALVCPRL